MSLLGQSSSWSLSGTYIGSITRAPSNNLYAHQMEASSFTFVAPATQVVAYLSIQRVAGTYTAFYGAGWRCTTLDTTPSAGRGLYLNYGAGTEQGTAHGEFPLTGLTVGSTYTMDMWFSTSTYNTALPAGSTVAMHSVLSVKG